MTHNNVARSYTDLEYQISRQEKADYGEQGIVSRANGDNLTNFIIQ